MRLPRCLGVALLLAGVYGCQRDEAAPPVGVTFTPPPAAHQVAQVGSEPVWDWQVEELARLHGQMLEQLGLPPLEADTPRQKLERALELVALAQVARRTLAAGGWLEEAGKRLLARVYLQRLVAYWDRQPVDEKRVRARYRELRRQVLSGEQSEIYKPTRIDALAVVVAFQPDLGVPQGPYKPVVTTEQAWQLARRFHARLAAAADTDDFLRVAREMQLGHPTVRVMEYWRTLADPDLSVLDRQLHRQLLALPAEGSVSPPFLTDRGVVILRRGATHPGHGEEFEQVRERLVELVRSERRSKYVADHLRELLERLGTRKYYRVLAGTGERVKGAQ